MESIHYLMTIFIHEVSDDDQISSQVRPGVDTIYITCAKSVTERIRLRTYAVLTF
jgi:hypothetical protein